MNPIKHVLLFLTFTYKHYFLRLKWICPRSHPGSAVQFRKDYLTSFSSVQLFWVDLDSRIHKHSLPKSGPSFHLLWHLPDKAANGGINAI